MFSPSGRFLQEQKEFKIKWTVLQNKNVFKEWSFSYRGLKKTLIGEFLRNLK